MFSTPQRLGNHTQQSENGLASSNATTQTGMYVIPCQDVCVSVCLWTECTGPESWHVNSCGLVLHFLGVAGARSTHEDVVRGFRNTRLSLGIIIGRKIGNEAECGCFCSGRNMRACLCRRQPICGYVWSVRVLWAWGLHMWSFVCGSLCPCMCGVQQGAVFAGLVYAVEGLKVRGEWGWAWFHSGASALKHHSDAWLMDQGTRAFKSECDFLPASFFFSTQRFEQHVS